MTRRNQEPAQSETEETADQPDVEVDEKPARGKSAKVWVQYRRRTVQLGAHNRRNDGPRAIDKADLPEYEALGYKVVDAPHGGG